MPGNNRVTRTSDPEWEYFDRARGGDENAWRVLVSQYQPRLAALALLLTKSVSAVDDIVQETFVRALEAKIHHHRGTVSGFLGTIAYRLALKEAKRARRDNTFDGCEPTDADRDPLERLLDEERDRLVARAIARLGREHREVLVLRCYGGHSYQEIADLAGIPLGTVKSRMFNAVKSCREMLREEGVVP